MWITAWLLVGSMISQQVMFPPFSSREDCEAVRQHYGKFNHPDATKCIQAKVFVNVPR
jgi:hypothetical protein